ncbi:MAG: hypothetical protein EXS55_03735 [Candidatus Magasanikbacteria bacterium]|nr:hypothetical protein [Candidatus Magasanikbacteria bacterium]
MRRTLAKSLKLCLVAILMIAGFSVCLSHANATEHANYEERTVLSISDVHPHCCANQPTVVKAKISNAVSVGDYTKATWKNGGGCHAIVSGIIGVSANLSSTLSYSHYKELIPITQQQFSVVMRS